MLAAMGDLNTRLRQATGIHSCRWGILLVCVVGARKYGEPESLPWQVPTCLLASRVAEPNTVAISPAIPVSQGISVPGMGEPRARCC